MKTKRKFAHVRNVSVTQIIAVKRCFSKDSNTNYTNDEIIMFIERCHLWY